MMSLSQRDAFQDSLHSLLSWFLDARSATLDEEGEHRPDALANHLACAYRQLALDPPRMDALPIHKMVPDFDREAYGRVDRDYRGRVIALCGVIADELGEFLTHAYLHGSLATGDYKRGWSDTDTFLVISQETATDGRRLLALRQRCLAAWELFLKICPLQHHGFIVCTEGDLKAYSSHYLPVPVFDTAVSLLPQQPPAVFYPRAAENGALQSLVERRDALQRAEADGILRHHPKSGVYLQSQYHNANDGMGQLYSLLCYLMVVPAFVLDARGEACDKKRSFSRARPLFSDASWSLIERSSAIRAMWPEKEGLVFAGNAIPLWVQDLLGADYIAEASAFLDEAVRVASMTTPQASQLA